MPDRCLALAVEPVNVMSELHLCGMTVVCAWNHLPAQQPQLGALCDVACRNRKRERTLAIAVLGIVQANAASTLVLLAYRAQNLMAQTHFIYPFNS